MRTEEIQLKTYSINNLINQYPDSIPKLAWIYLQNAVSFKYQYQFKSDLPHNNTATYKGLIMFPNQEQRQGKYTIENRNRDVMIKARLNYQYKIDRKTKQWQVLPRDEDANLMFTIERVITNTRFYLIEQDSNKLIYSFHPNLSFLDPTFTRRIKAKLSIDRKTLLPIQFSAKDSLEKIVWRIDFSDYNKQDRIKFPFVPNTQIYLATNEKLAQNEINSITEILTKRLELTGENFQIKNKSEKKRVIFEIEMEIPASNPDYQLLKKLLTQTGKCDIYQLSESVSLVNNSNIRDVKIVGFEPYPQLEVQINQNGVDQLNKCLNDTNNESDFRIVFDGEELAIFSIDKFNFSDRILFRVFTKKNEIMNTIAILKSGILSSPLEIINLRTGR